MSEIANAKDLSRTFARLGVMAKDAAKAIAEFGAAIAAYCESDAKTTYQCYLWSLSNNERKRKGLALKRSRAFQKAKRNERRKK